VTRVSGAARRIHVVASIAKASVSLRGVAIFLPSPVRAIQQASLA